jgi:hypothetical protein
MECVQQDFAMQGIVCPTHLQAVFQRPVKAMAQTQSKAPRFPQLTVEQLNPQQKALAREILKVSSAGIGGPYNVLLRSPEMAEPGFGSRPSW